MFGGAEPGQPGLHPAAHPGRLTGAERAAQPHDAALGELRPGLLAEHDLTISRRDPQAQRIIRSRSGALQAAQ
jgi:hypothetical protein